MPVSVTELHSDLSLPEEGSCYVVWRYRIKTKSTLFHPRHITVVILYRHRLSPCILQTAAQKKKKNLFKYVTLAKLRCSPQELITLLFTGAPRINKKVKLPCSTFNLIDLPWDLYNSTLFLTSSSQTSQRY